MIFSEELLNYLGVEAEQQISQDLPGCIFFRFIFALTAGKSVYTLPSYVRTIKRITYRGRKLDELSWDEFQLVTPATAVVSEVNKIEGSEGTPLYYALHPTDLYAIRFYPTPTVTTLDTGDAYSPIVENKLIISCTRAIDNSLANPLLMLPTYIDRRTRKAFILDKAFQAEGKGQDLKASNYYNNKYKYLIDNFRHINESCYVAKKYSLGEDNLYDGYKYPKPILGPNFERNY